MKRERVNGRVIIQISIMWVFVLAIILTSIIAFFRNRIFATNVVKEDTLSVVEPNQNSVDILKLMVENNYLNKKLVNEERKIDYNKQEILDDQLPKGEKKVSNIITEPIDKITHIGTSEFLEKYKVHIGEEMYLTETTELKEEAKKDSKDLVTINRYLNFEILQVSKDWTKVKFKEFEGYLPNNKLTSEAVSPLILEQNRVARIKDSLNKDMDLTAPSGLTLSDYKTILGYNASDKNSIFADNYEAFYNAEQKYGVNGIFIAAVGIHESAWGTSYLAKEKNNLFGYRAYDRDPINSAQDFETYVDAINVVAEALSKNYLTPTGSYYNGTTIEAINTKYASDKAWHEKVFSYMELLYDKLG